MSRTKCYAAVDLGAESGRIMLGELGDGKLTLTEIHRFPNGPTEQAGSLRWDFDRLMTEIKTGLGKAAQKTRGAIESLGVNSWGVDFGLLDAQGKLIEAPYHYRDSRTDGMLEEAFRRMPKRDIYGHTGIQFMQLNTVFQLLAMRVKKDPALDRAEKLLFMANLVSHQLGGGAVAEYTLASTSQMMDMRTGAWSDELLKGLDLPRKILPGVAQPGCVIGRLRGDLRHPLGCGPIQIVAIGSHDTASAVAAVPARGEDWAYISSGTWSLMGLELPKPVIDDVTFQHSLTNEGGVEGTIRLLKNIMGLWLVQECRRQWQREGQEFSYAQLADMAAKARPFAATISPDYGPFLSPGDMPARINQHLAETKQAALTDKGEMVRAVLESLAFTYRRTLENLESVSGRKIGVIHIVGGGTQNEALSQFAANATGRTVITGPVEATSAGNILLQAKALGQIGSLADMREIVRRSFPTKEFAPRDAALWSAQYEEWRKRA